MVIFVQENSYFSNFIEHKFTGICTYLRSKSFTCTAYIIGKNLYKITGKISFKLFEIKFHTGLHNASNSPIRI